MENPTDKHRLKTADMSSVFFTKDQMLELRYTVSAPGLTAFSEETLQMKVLSEDNKKPSLEVSRKYNTPTTKL